MLQRDRAAEQRYAYVKFELHFTQLLANQAQVLSQLEDLLYTREGSQQSEQTMLDLASLYGFEACFLEAEHLGNEHCLLDAIVFQLHQLRKVTDSDELRQEAVKYLETCPSLKDGTLLKNFVEDEEWHRYLEQMRENHFCDHLMLVALATVLRRTIILYSGAEPNLEPIRIIPDNVNERLQPIHVGHVSGLIFVTLRPVSGPQAQDDDVDNRPDETESIIQEDEVEEDDVIDADGPSALHQRTPAGETSCWNVC